MKKNLFAYLFTMLCSVALFSSCSDDDSNGISGPMVGTWNVAEIEKDENDTFVSGPVQMTWETEKGTTIGGLPVTMIPAMGNGFGSIALSQVLKEVTLDPEGNITAVYADEVNLQKPIPNPEWKDTGKGYATYQKVNDNQILVFLDLNKIMGSVASREDNNPLNQVMALVKNGIPVNIAYEGNKAYFYIDKALLDKIVPLMPALAEMISDDAMGGMGAMLKGILKDFPNAWEKTTKFEVGLNLKK